MTVTKQAPTMAEIVASFGLVKAEPLSRVQGFTAKAMVRSWTTIPHVTHFDRLDVTELERFRAATNADRAADQRLSPLPYLMKAVAKVLADLPRFNSVLDVEAGAVLLRQYVNVGIAIDTPSGLVVGVVRGCDQLSIEDIALAAKALAAKAVAKGLSLAEMSGSGFTISSLGALGGDGFTPIINAPEVAILAVSRLAETPCKGADGQIEWRKQLPVALSYDHRVINGADAGRFMQRLQHHIDALSTA